MSRTTVSGKTGRLLDSFPGDSSYNPLLLADFLVQFKVPVDYQSGRDYAQLPYHGGPGYCQDVAAALRRVTLEMATDHLSRWKHAYSKDTTPKQILDGCRRDAAYFARLKNGYTALS